MSIKVIDISSKLRELSNILVSEIFCQVCLDPFLECVWTLFLVYCIVINSKWGWVPLSMDILVVQYSLSLPCRRLISSDFFSVFSF